MSIYDHHRRRLGPYVWQPDETSLTSRTRAQLDEQVRTRFPTAVGVYLVGDLVGHYWDEESELDVLVRVPDDDLPGYREDARIASGHKLLPSEHRVGFWLMSENKSPGHAAWHFGPLYDVASGQWFGERVTDINEMTRPGAILRRANWRLYKAKQGLELFPEEWTVTTAAFGAMPANERERLLDNLRLKTAELDKGIRDGLKREADGSVWKALDEFEEQLAAEEDEDLPIRYVDGSLLPERLVKDVLHKFRYVDLLGTLEEIHTSKVEFDQADFEQEVRMGSHAAEAPEPQEERKELIRHRGKVWSLIDANASQLWTRLDSIVSQLVMSSGGYAAATETIYQMFDRILDTSKYINTTTRRREIVYRLYRKYYQGKSE